MVSIWSLLTGGKDVSGEFVDLDLLEAEVIRAAEAWLIAREACCTTAVGDPTWRSLLNNLSTAEDNLAKAVRTYR